MRPVFSRALAATALSTSALIGLAAPAYAQDTGPDEASATDGEIIVEARRRSESLQDTPVLLASSSDA
jgi:iron complex outermembrane receptor protein